MEMDQELVGLGFAIVVVTVSQQGSKLDLGNTAVAMREHAAAVMVAVMVSALVSPPASPPAFLQLRRHFEWPFVAVVVAAVAAGAACT
ncbi:hypothetical protein OGATHE_002698 [Ogataea polymorpha]|uniref:Uncharacterized protein n=1 Tax=Ogataea polymorpha TaxID=460523 RepID=A0A9P8T8H5_9ASCO|nr:hypothetical protein OGATHE_002698 [Ogataea polymorpha]